MMGQHLPEIVDPVDLAGRHDVVVDRAHLGARVGVFDHRHARHVGLPQSGWMPAFSTTARQRATSAAIKAPSASDGANSGTMPCFSRPSLTSERARISARSRAHLAVISGGSLAGPKMPYHSSISMFS